MITIIHGDDTVASREQLYRFKNQVKNNEVLNLSGEKNTTIEIINMLSTSSLFSADRTVIIQDLFALGSEKQKETLFHFLQKTNQNDQIIIWEDKEIKSNILKKYFPKAKIILCKIPQTVFRFLDNIGLQSLDNTLKSFQEITAYQEAEFIYVMLLRQMRLLIIAKETGGKGTSLAPWQIHKLTGQSRFFNMEKLISMYRQLLHLEYKIKTGQTPLDMKESLDIFFTGL